jgi:hypothetical protein
MTTKTARNLRPAYGDLQAAVLIMAVRYAEANVDYAKNISAAEVDYRTAKRAVDRRFAALRRLTAALANR